MTETGWRPIDGDEIVTTAPAVTPAEDDVHTAETAAAPDFISPPPEDDDAPLRTARPARSFDLRWLALAAIGVLVLLQLVVSFLALGSVNQLRDQSAASFGLQKCLYNAQLNATDTTTAQNAIKVCLSK